MSDVIHVIISYRGKWAVRRTGAVRARRLFAYRRSGIRFGRRLARASQLPLVIHSTDGTVHSWED